MNLLYFCMFQFKRPLSGSFYSIAAAVANINNFVLSVVIYYLFLYVDFTGLS
jgi:hypothetical protein